MKIVSLKAENVKCLKAVHIEPDGSIVQITGANGAGKSTVLDSIMYALCGKDVIPTQPIRRGEDHAEINVDLGDYTVTRRFTAEGNTTLTVKSKEGAKFPSPQSLLDKIVGPAFDPLAFTKHPAKQQLETLRQLVGIDFTKLNEERKGHYESRTMANRDAAAVENRLSAMPEHKDAPAEEVSVGELVDKLRQVDEYNRARANVEQQHATALASANRLIEEIKGIRQTLDRAERNLEDQKSLVQKHHLTLAEMPVKDAAPIKDQIASAETTNRKVRENKARAELALKLTEYKETAQTLSDAIGAIDTQKQKILSEARFPVDGLSIDDNGVTYNGLPFTQASSAEQLRVSVAIGLAANPKLKVLLIRDGSLLDANGMQLITEMADQAGAQVWIERVATDEAVGIVIEDGQVVSRVSEPAAA